MTENKM